MAEIRDITGERERIRALSRRVFWRWLIPTLGEWVTILALFWIGFALHSWVVWAVIVIVLGSRQQALGLLGHDGAHFAAATDKHVNDFFSALFCFWPMLTTLGDYRRFHLMHHRLLNTEKDPERIFKKELSPNQWKYPVTRKRIFLYFATDLCGAGIFEVVKARKLLRWCREESGVKSRWTMELGPALWFACIVAILFATGYEFALLIWFLSLGTSFWAFLRLRTWTEHFGTAKTHFVKLNWFERLAITPHASWSHHEHHEHPSVPFWAREQICDPEARTQSLWELLGSFG
ncbi:MAG TPA: fatty acid desaturase [Candidatus Kapabacteria bacterium]|jgi:fatty acid desaturase